MAASEWRMPIEKHFPQARFDEPLSRHTTFRIGGPADCYLEIANRKQLAEFFKLAGEYRIPVFMLGWGSNLLVADGGVRGAAVRLRGNFENIEFLDDCRVRAGAGLRVPQLASLAAEQGLCGVESLVGVPGTVGGALVMNAGTRDGEIGPLVLEVEVYDPAALCFQRVKAPELRFSYRSSNLDGRIVLSCLLKLKAGGKGDIMARIQQFQQRRLETQPVHTHNVGSVFKNPPGRFVARLIEDAGLKGKVLGGARVSPQHANFIENFSRASARDVLELVRLIRDEIRSRFAIELELEMKVVGEP